jgi:hypothetical protein
MKRLFILFSISCVLLFIVFAQPRAGIIIGGSVDTGGCSTSNDSQLESFATSASSWEGVSGSTWRGQSFNHDTAFTLTEMIFNVQDAGSDTGSLVCAVYSGYDSSTLVDGTSVTVAATSIGASDDTVAFTLDSPVELSGSTDYAIMLHAIDSGSFELHRGGNTYGSGVSMYSTNGGSSFLTSSSYDYEGEVWGCE